MCSTFISDGGKPSAAGVRDMIASFPLPKMCGEAINLHLALDLLSQGLELVHFELLLRPANA